MNAEEAQAGSGAPGYYRYWGKADEAQPGCHRLVYHCLDVAAVGSVLAERRPRWLHALARLGRLDLPGLAETLTFLLAIHDLGKFGDGFQRLREDVAHSLGRATVNVANSPRHDTTGFLLWKELSSHRSEHQVAEVLLQVMSAGAPVPAREARELLEPVMAAALGHHGTPPAIANPGILFDRFGLGRADGSWKDAGDYAVAVRSLLSPPGLIIQDRADPDSLRRASWWLAGFAILCDWIGSNPTWFPYEPAIVPLGSYWQTALGLARDAVEEAGVTPRKVQPFGGFAKLFPSASFRPSPLQRLAETLPLASGPQMHLLEDLTGSGKTEAALTLVGRLFDAGLADGLYFALPTMATANAMFSRVLGVLPQLFQPDPKWSFVLAHSGPRLVGTDGGIASGALERQPATSYSPGEQSASSSARSWLADGRKKALLADAGVGTIDQALVAALRSKHNSLRLLGLHGHALVVDEVHACDEYMNGILEQLLEVHAAMGGSAILLSATLPLAARERLVNAFRKGLQASPNVLTDRAYPSLASTSGHATVVEPVEPTPGAARTVAVEFLDSADATIEWCCAQASHGSCVAWIRNTVRDALEAYDDVATRLGGERVQVFHARFPLGDRLALEQDIVGRFGPLGGDDGRRGRVVVATQVMEQSLDVDFDCMVTDLAPIDRLIQRCGRMHRHARGARGEPTLRVLAPPWSELPDPDWPGKEFAGTRAVYGRPSVLWRTQRVLQDERRLALPARARFLVEAVFGPDGAAVPDSLVNADRELASEAEELQRSSMAAYNRISFDSGYLRSGAQWSDEERAPTRLGEASTIIRLVRAVGDQLLPWASNESLSLPVRWRLGEASVRISQVSSSGDEIRDRLEDTAGEVPPYVVPISMKDQGGAWRGQAARRMRSGKELPVKVVFRPGRGLDFEKEG